MEHDLKWRIQLMTNGIKTNGRLAYLINDPQCLYRVRNSMNRGSQINDSLKIQFLWTAKQIHDSCSNLSYIYFSFKITLMLMSELVVGLSPYTDCMYYSQCK